MKKSLIVALLVAIPAAGVAQTVTMLPQTPESFDWKVKLQFHSKKAYGPLAIVASPHTPQPSRNLTLRESGDRAAPPTASASPPHSAGRGSTALSHSAWIPRCTRTRVT